ncbi:MAG TPA: NAD(P)/FAD-dependent oxidoreductase, partial [Candidatus Saccharimonadales bacterium]
MSDNKKTRILIVGGGFAGVKSALELGKNKDCKVTLLSDHSHFRYYPGLYHTATGGRRAGARIRLENILQDTPGKFVRDRAVTLDRKNKVVITKGGKKLAYDKLLLALGNVTNYFGIQGLKEYSLGIKSTEDAEKFKKHLHQQFADNSCPDLNYFIVGGGPTGIELAGALPSYIKRIMKKHGVKDRKLNISLIEAAPHLLPRAPKDVSSDITKRLRKLGIKLYLGTAVKGQDSDSLMFGDKDLPSHTVVWTAGVTNHPFFKDNQFKLNERGKVEVNQYLEAEPDIYILGDNANTLYSGMAQTALHDGQFVAKNIIREIRGGSPKEYEPKQPVSVIPVGPYWASVEWGKRHFSGFTGWILRILADLVGFHDLQSWPKAGGQWMQSLTEEDLDCP